jgi:phage/plasmid-like protein (TIGR03299 family)
MSHNIAQHVNSLINDQPVYGDYRFYYQGDRAWHSLGQKWNTSPSVDQAVRDLVRSDHELRRVLDTDGEIIDEMQEVWLPYRDASGNQIRKANGKAAGQRCGLVGPEYTILQDREVLELCRPFVESGLAEIHTCGAILGGTQFWVLLKIKRDPADVTPGDSIEQYILMVNGHNGEIAFKALPTNIRVVCNNTLTMALRSALNKLFRAKHRRNVHIKAQEARDAVASLQGIFLEDVAKFRELARVNVANEIAAKVYFQQVLGKKPDAAEEVNLESKRPLGTLMRLFDHEGVGLDIPGVRGTWWSAYNAVTEFVTHMRGRNDDSRLDNMVNGLGYQLSQKALKLGLEAANGQLSLG